MDRVVDIPLKLYNTSWQHSLETFVYILGTENLVFKCHFVCRDVSQVCGLKAT